MTEETKRPPSHLERYANSNGRRVRVATFPDATFSPLSAGWSSPGYLKLSLGSGYDESGKPHPYNYVVSIGPGQSHVVTGLLEYGLRYDVVRVANVVETIVESQQRMEITVALVAKMPTDEKRRLYQRLTRELREDLERADRLLAELDSLADDKKEEAV
jgi:hypothetical protein